VTLIGPGAALISGSIGRARLAEMGARRLTALDPLKDGRFFAKFDSPPAETVLAAVSALLARHASRAPAPADANGSSGTSIVANVDTLIDDAALARSWAQALLKGGTDRSFTDFCNHRV